MKSFNLKHLIFFTVLYGFFSIFIFGFITYDGLSIWMGINVGFAMIPLIVIVYLYKRYQEITRIDWILIVGLFIFIFFYPNSFYIMTDFMHIDTHDFYTSTIYVGNVYRHLIDPYFLMFHIIISALVGMVAGIESLIYLEKLTKQIFKNPYITNLVIITMLFLSSLGIYIGRFLRFFSWDILRPIKLLNTFFESFSLFTIEFTVLFTIFEIFIYYGYKTLKRVPTE